MRVTLLWFAALRERRGVASEVMYVPEGTTLAALYARCIPDDRIPVAHVRNQRVCAPDERVADGDEVAFLPPLGGG